MRTKMPLLLLFLLLGAFAHAQPKFWVRTLDADSLAILIPAKQGTDKIDAMNLLSNVICRKDFDSSLALARTAINLSEKLDYKKGLADGYFNSGNVYFLMENLELTMFNYLKAQRIYEDIEPSLEYAQLLSQLGMLDDNTARLNDPSNVGWKALRIYEKLNDREGQYAVNMGKGLWKVLIDPIQMDSAIYFLNRSMLFVDTVREQNKTGHLYNVIAYAYRMQFFETLDTSSIDKAFFWLNKALKLTEIKPYLRGILYRNSMTLYDKLGTDEGLDSCVVILKKLKYLCDTCVTAEDYENSEFKWSGRVSYRQGDYERAIWWYTQQIKWVEKALAGFSVNDKDNPLLGYDHKFELKKSKVDSYQQLSDIYATLGDYKKTFEYYVLSKQAEEEISLEKNQIIFTLREAESKYEKSKSRIDLLSRDNELKALAIRQSRMMNFGFAAFFIAVVLALLFLWRMSRLKIRNKALVQEQKLLHDLELKKLEAEKLVELDRLKSRFFANISHEFRTPLTLIMGPVDKVLAQTDNKDHKKDLGIARKYAGKLQTLINNLLTISRLESGNLQLHAAQTDIVKLVRSYFQAFESLAGQKHIALKFSAGENEIPVFLDREKFEQILSNLLSNAVKFTGEEGVIEVTVDRVQPPAGSGQEVWIKVSDTGCGIDPEHLGHVFDRFYQVEHKEKGYYEGTGIGLALTKELVELHHGTIHVESEPGKGSCFILQLPLGKDHLAAEEIADGSSPETVTPAMPLDMPGAGVEPALAEEIITGANGNQPILLIVEDNADMRAYIREYFESAFSIVEATDGMDGLEKSVEHVPDIIISDVMMPVMEGNEFCRKVKTDERTSHIPVILLTARASAENKMEGLETGADDFISKPFDGKELQVRVKNLVEQRKKLRELLEARIRRSGNALQPDLAGSGIASMDERFLQRVFDKLRENYPEAAFGAAEFSAAVGLSISQLNRKIRALTGETTIGLIRTYRLNRASELLGRKSATVAEIAYDVGFSSPSYFTECFRQQFGKTPSEFSGNQ